jgi:hypothetical protein
MAKSSMNVKIIYKKRHVNEKIVKTRWSFHCHVCVSILQIPIAKIYIYIKSSSHHDDDNVMQWMCWINHFSNLHNTGLALS